MKARRFAICVIALALVQLFTSALAFSFAPEVGSAFLMVMRAPKDPDLSLPLLTRNVALPLLRVQAPDPHNRPVTVLWARLVWGVVLLIPPLSAALMVWSSDTRKELPRYFLLQLSWLTLCALLFVLVTAGLALPMACL